MAVTVTEFDPNDDTPTMAALPPQGRNIYERIAAVMQEVDYIQKDKKAGMKYSIVSHDVVTAKLRPAIVRHGIVYHPTDIEVAQNGNRTQVKMNVRFACADATANSPKFIEVASVGYGIDDQDKGPGKAISYAVKYALLKTFGLETGDDPDHDQETTHEGTVAATLKTAIGMASELSELTEVVLPQITELASELTNVELSVVRQKYAARRKELQAQADEEGQEDRPKGGKGRKS